ncbi:hypothetical protein DL770_007497 [Monosporascus sp. CRB-9-2]|nr:hypothetical protein DL770_007497 [Monosporascus sp. CRB-9-2]
MDPFSVIGLAGNMITFLEFGYNVVSKARDIQSSASGASSANTSLASMAQRLDDVASALQESGAGAAMSSQENSLTQLAAECRELSVDLLAALEALRAKNPSSEFRDRLTKLTEYGQCSKDELESLSRNMQSLRLGSQVSCLSPNALDHIRMLLNLSDQAMMKVRESRVLAALRFELMDERFHDVTEVHEQTYDWIFERSPHALDENKDGPKALVFAKFFWKPGTKLQKSLGGLTRGLLYCLLSNSPNLIPVALPAEWAASRVREDINLDRDQIKNTSDRVISSTEPSRGHKFFFMIDGLDEFTGCHAELIRRLFDWTGKTADVKMTPGVTPKIGSIVINKADGVFLWVSIILRLIEEGITDGDQMHDLEHKIDLLSTE